MNIGGILTAVIPSVALLGLFWFTMRGIIRADRREREAQAKLDREEEAAAQTAAGQAEQAVDGSST